MGSRRVFVFGFAGISTFISARAARGQTPDPSRPPQMVLRASGGEQRAALGTYCWGGMCVDMASPFYYPACPLPVAAGETLSLDFAALGPLRRLSYAVWPFAENIQPGPPSWSAKTSASPVHEDVVVRPVSPIPLPAGLPPGLFVIEVFAQARRGGDTSQGFKLLVQPLTLSATPTIPNATPSVEPGCEGKEE